MRRQTIIILSVIVLVLILIIALSVKFEIVDFTKINESNDTIHTNNTTNATNIIGIEEVEDNNINDGEKKGGLWYALGGSIIIFVVGLILNKAYKTRAILREGTIEDQDLKDVKRAVIEYWADEYELILDENGNTDDLEFLDSELDKKGEDENFILFNIRVLSGTKIGTHFIKIKLNQPIENIEAGKFKKIFNTTMHTYVKVKDVKDWREKDITTMRLQSLASISPDQISEEAPRELIREIIREGKDEDYKSKPFDSSKEDEK